MEDEIGVGYRIYITGDTLYVDELEKIPEYLKNQRLDLMLVHLGGTTIPGPSMPLVMVTMDAKQGLQLMRLVDPDVTIPIHYDDYNVFLSPLSDFKDQVDKDGYEKRVVYLDRGDAYGFSVKDASSVL
jgi:L-ascorbate metabolism protein UlaG (beta-lactamase superfamily)